MEKSTKSYITEPEVIVFSWSLLALYETGSSAGFLRWYRYEFIQRSCPSRIMFSLADSLQPPFFGFSFQIFTLKCLMSIWNSLGWTPSYYLRHSLVLWNPHTLLLWRTVEMGFSLLPFLLTLP